MANKAIIIIVLLAIIAFYALCLYIDANRIRAGWIIDKRHVKAHYEEYVTHERSGDVSIPVYHSRYVPDSWSFIIRDAGETAKWAVYEAVYNKYEVGDWFDVSVEGTAW